MHFTSEKALIAGNSFITRTIQSATLNNKFLNDTSRNVCCHKRLAQLGSASWLQLGELGQEISGDEFHQHWWPAHKLLPAAVFLIEREKGLQLKRLDPAIKYRKSATRPSPDHQGEPFPIKRYRRFHPLERSIAAVLVNRCSHLGRLLDKKDETAHANISKADL